MLKKPLKPVKNKNTKIIYIGKKDNFQEQEAIILTPTEYENLMKKSNIEYDHHKYETQIQILNNELELNKKLLQEYKTQNQELKEKNNKLTSELKETSNKITKIKDTFIKDIIKTNDKFNYILSELKSLSLIDIIIHSKHKKIIREYEQKKNMEQLITLDLNLID